MDSTTALGRAQRTVTDAVLDALRASTYDPASGVSPEDMIAITATVRGVRADYQPAGSHQPIESYEIEHRTLGRRLACNIERCGDTTWRSIGPLAGPDYYHRPHASLADAAAWVVDILDRLACARPVGAAYRSRLRRAAVRGNQAHDRHNFELLDACRELARQAADDEAFRADPDAYRRPTTADLLDTLNPYKYTRDPSQAAGLTWQQLKYEIEQAVRDGMPDIAAAFQAERDRRDTDNAERRARLGMPAAPPGLRFVEQPSDSGVFDAIEAERTQGKS